jgi:peptide/nickel transport system substrate-binding protein
MKRFSTWLLLVMLCSWTALAQVNPGELRFCVRSDPKTFDPLMVSDEVSDTVRYLTGGVLIRVNRKTQQAEPELASSWKISADGKTITFKLRPNIYFSDGTPFTADDVAATVKRMMDPNTHSPVGDGFGASTTPFDIKTQPGTVSITFPTQIAGLERLFDEVAITSTKSPNKDKASLGPFYLADYKSGSFIHFNRNPNYWKKDAQGKALPYLQSVRLEIQGNRDIEMTEFQRGQVQLITSLDAEYFERLTSATPGAARAIGVSLDSEQMWFNQVPNAPIPAYKLDWFKSTSFRNAVSMAINRSDLARVAFNSHARPAYGPVSPADKFWFDQKLKPLPFDASSAQKLLSKEGFQLAGGVLRDSGGHEVEFSIVTNAGNKYRERMATMIQQDLSKLGIKVNIVTLDFPSLIERITSKFNYEAALLGTVHGGIGDPNDGMNQWLSSGENHQWNPSQKTPATEWEAEIDKLMKTQSALTVAAKRKPYFDKVQEILVREQPFIYLINKEAMAAIAPSVHNVDPVVLRPQTYWNVDRLWVENK